MGVLLVSIAASVAAIGAFLPGYNIGSVNGLQNYLGFLKYFNLGSTETNSSDACTSVDHLSENSQLILGTIVSVVFLGTATGNLIAGKLSDLLGRKAVLLLSGVFFVLGAAVLGTALQGAVWMLIVGRIITGLGFGTFFMACPVYIAEIAPRHIRGRLSSLIAPSLTVGLLTGYAVNIGLSRVDAGWRVGSLLTAVFGCVYIVGVAFLPSSPRWLMLKGREADAREALKKLSISKDFIDAQIKEIKESLPLDKSSNCLQELKVFFLWKNIKRIILGILILVFQFATGNHIYFYSESLFCTLGVPPFVTSLIVGVCSVCGAIFANLFIDKLGRKVLLVGGGVLMALLVVIAGVLVDAFDLEEVEGGAGAIGYIVVVLISIFMLVYTATWFVTPIVIAGEIFALKGRALAVAVCLVCNGLAGYAFTQVFPLVLATLKAHGFLYLLASIEVAAILTVLLVLPETKGISLEDVDQLFAKPFLERTGLSKWLRCCKKYEIPSNNFDSSTSKSVQVETTLHSHSEGSLPHSEGSLPHSDGSWTVSETADEGWTQHFIDYEQEIENFVENVGNVGKE
ncbi:glucose transporter GlcP-like [Halichondria panicea]|uniref:glucose transporter GlcP-like n=1 Tax=Halichondria panicea TaxID=6063 RepID=UPI00312B6C22